MPFELNEHDFHLLELAAAKLPLPEAERFKWQDLVTAHRDAIRDLDSAYEAAEEKDERIEELEDDVQTCIDALESADAALKQSRELIEQTIKILKDRAE